jgi:hypothetical protein
MTPTDPSTLDAVSDALARHLLAASPPTRTYARADLAALPAPVARLAAARLDDIVRSEAEPTPSDWVDRDDEGLREATRAWREAVRTAARVPAAAWEGFLAETCRLAVAHLVRPAETLSAYAFEGVDHALPTALALRRARAFAPYAYLPEIAARYAERKEVPRISADELARLLRRIDIRMVGSFGPDEWLTLLQPLYELLAPVSGPQAAVPTPLLRTLFEARGQSDLAESLGERDALTAPMLLARLTAALPVLDDLDEIAASPSVAPSASPGVEPLDPEPAPLAPVGIASAPAAEPDGVEPAATEPAGPASAAEEADVLDVSDATEERLEDEDAPREAVEPEILQPEAARSAEDALDAWIFPDGKPERAPEAPPAPPSDPDPIVPPVIGSHYVPPAAAVADDSEVLGPARAAATPDDEPLWMRLSRQNDDAPAAPTTPSVPEGDEPLWKRFALGTDATATPAGVDADFEVLEARVLGLGARARRDGFVDALFDGSSEAYRAALARLDACATWTDAATFINEDIFRPRGVYLYSDPASAFTKAVESQYGASRAD